MKGFNIRRDTHGFPHSIEWCRNCCDIDNIKERAEAIISCLQIEWMCPSIECNECIKNGTKCSNPWKVYNISQHLGVDCYRNCSESFKNCEVGECEEREEENEKRT